MARPKMTEEQKAEATAKRQAERVEEAQEDNTLTLAQYIAARERDGIVLVRVTYPGAEPHVFPGTYSGIVVADGPRSCTYADGTTQDF